MALLEVTGISKNFGSTHVLQNISLNLEKGEALAIIGSSGSGKTTLLRCLNFLETPDTGVIRVDGKTLWDAADPATHRESEVRKKRLHFGLVFQNYALYPHMTVADNIMFPLINRKVPKAEARERAQEMAKLVQLDIEYGIDDAAVKQALESIEKSEGITLDDMQREAVIGAIRNGLMIITGGPGTGKTTIINTIIRYFEMEGMDIRLAAPTGRAAKRMSETTGYEAQTVHRLLEVNGGMDDEHSGAGSHFERNEMNPLETDVIIVDEMSMVDINLINALLAAVVDGTRLILVGDVDQLPSVGPGNVLRDMINSECFNVVKLTRIFRQSDESEIITNAHAINRGEDVALNKYSRDFLFIHRDTPEAIIAALCTVVRDKLPRYVDAEVSEIQVMTPMRKGVVGVEKLNQTLQTYLNPPEASKLEKEFGQVTFRVGDKVMQIRNNYQIEWERRSRYGIVNETGMGVFNGDTGIIEEIRPYTEEVVVRFDDDRYVKYGYKQLEELELAYAITVHKSQGSEYPAVIIPMFPGPRMLMTRNLLYTAVTRARKCVCLIGREDCFREMIANGNEQKRYSSLDVRIKEVRGD